MSRDITSSVITASQAEVVRPAWLARLDFSSGVSAFNSSTITPSYGGDHYLGVGDMGQIDTISESDDLSPSGITLALSGIVNDYLSIAINEDYQGRDCKVYFALLDESFDLIADPVLVFQGRMDTMTANIGAETSSVLLTVENHLADWNRPRVRRYNQRDQQVDYPSDLGLEFIEQITDKPIVWGQNPAGYKKRFHLR